MQSIFGKNKNSLSYSSLSCWLQSKAEYRKRYYEKQPFISTPEIDFGKKIADRLETRDPALAHIEQYSHPEHKISLTIDGVKVVGYIDSYCPKTKSIIEYKTSRTKYWNQKTVNKHLQLDLYSLAVEHLYDEVNETTKLIWLETKKINEKTTGLIPVEGAYEVALTGKVETFERVISKEDRLAMRRLIVDVAKDIADDYKFHSTTTQRSS
jgi:hypothetical protein